MSNQTLETWIWVLIYGGLLGFVLGHFVTAYDQVLGHGLSLLGLLAVVAGAVGIVWRSRRPD
jgi:membrane protein DedA with SNARE-associated domain